MNTKSIVFDTNVLMSCPSIIKKFIDLYDITVPMTVVRELDHLKTNQDVNRSTSARRAIRAIEKYKDNLSFDYLDYDSQSNENNDDKILDCAKNHNAYICTNDLAMRIKASANGIDIISPVDTEDIYKGYKYVILDENEMSDFYEHLSNNMFDCLVNEYVIIKNIDNEIVDKYRWDGKSYVPIRYRAFENKYTDGKIKPRNVEQELALDLLFNCDIPVKVIIGKQGSGKTFLSTSSALQLVNNQKYDNILYMRNNYGVRNTKELGSLPGDVFAKVAPFVAPFADHVGGIYGLEMLMREGKIEVEHLGYIRGRDFKNKIVMVNESENLTKEHIQLLLGRISSGSSLWLDGDLKQIDDDVFVRNNGLQSIIDHLKGNPLFGCVTLTKTERSEVANLADCLDVEDI